MFYINSMMLSSFLFASMVYHVSSTYTTIKEEVGEEPEIDYHEVTATSGSYVTMYCNTAHHDFSKVYWFRNDSKQVVASKSRGYEDVKVHRNFTDRLSFENRNIMVGPCHLNDDSFYYCITTQNFTNITGGYIKLTVQEKPSCDVTISKLTVLNGTIAHLPCGAKGNPKPTIQWRKFNSKKIFDARFITSSQGLSIYHVEKEDAGPYQVTLYNSVGTFTHPITLVVQSVDEIEPANYKAVVEGKAVSIECGKRPVNPGDTVSWTKDGRIIKDKRFSVDQKGYLNVNPANKNDSGFYSCASTRKTPDGELTLSINMYLNVEYPPHIIYHKNKVAVFKDQKAKMPCNAIGNPSVFFRWLLPRGVEVRNNEKYQIARDGSLTVNQVDMSDVGNYTCAPHNDIGDGKHKLTELVILIPPAFLSTKSSTEIVASAGEKVTLDCSSSGIPRPNVTWTRKEEPIVNNGIIYDTVGLLLFRQVRVSDVGTYFCDVSSVAGSINRTISLKVIGIPAAPKRISLYTANDIGYLSWQPSYNGGYKQVFEVWYRPTYLTDFDWSVKGTNITKVEVHLAEDYFDALGNEIKYYFSVRAINEKGASHFSGVREVGRQKFSQSNGYELNSLISTFPLEPYDIFLNMTKEGYLLRWKVLNTPGRPTSNRIGIRYREANTTDGWKTYSRHTQRTRRAVDDGSSSSLYIDANDITDVNQPAEFQVYTLTPNNVQSKPSSPSSVTITGMPGGKVKPVTQGNKDTDITPYILGGIFGLFLILLLVCLYCFCRKRKRRYHARHNEKKVEYHLENGTEIKDESDSAKLLSPILNQDSPRRFHFRQCPALKLGKFSNHGISGSENEDVHVLLEPNKEEKNLCTCNRKYFTLNSEDAKKLKKSRKEKKRLYKSSSSPSVLLTSDIDGSSIDPSDLLDEEEYDISDIEKDTVADLKSEKVSTLNRSKFKDSYDQFCKPEDARKRLNSNDKPEADKYLGKESHDASSENSATESERPGSPSDVKSFDGKSSGFGEGSNSTSDSESVNHENHKPLLLKPAAYNLKFVNDSKRDMGYVSDVSTRSSPLDYTNKNKYIPPSQRHKLNNNNNKRYYSEDEADRPRAPPPYSQAMVDIERMSDKNEITDSEELYDHLLAMQRQLGVQLDDSVESDINEIPPPVRSNSARHYNTESGYMSDIGTTRYSEREKSERCAQLLNEFKSSRKGRVNNNVSDEIDEKEEYPVKPPTVRCHSVMDNIITEEPRLPPVLKRSNSAGSSSIYKEWLV